MAEARLKRNDLTQPDIHRYSLSGIPFGFNSQYITGPLQNKER